MTQHVPPRVDVIATTSFQTPPDVPWQTDAGGGEALAEFAGRACYHSWSKPRPATATNAGYLSHIIEVGHLSVLEHSQVTMYIRDVSRTMTHELIRHRHFSFSQLSARHIGEDSPFVLPQVADASDEIRRTFEDAVEAAHAAYERVVELVDEHLDAADSLLRRKRARQAAQTLLPGARTTDIVMTGNLRAWRQLIATHGTEQADDDLRELAVTCLERLLEVAPNAFSDFVITKLSDGRRLASSALVTEG